MGVKNYRSSGSSEDCDDAFEQLVSLMGVTAPVRRFTWRPEDHVDPASDNLLIEAETDRMPLSWANATAALGMCRAVSGPSGANCWAYPFGKTKLRMPNALTEDWGIAFRMKRVSSLATGWAASIKLTDSYGPDSYVSAGMDYVKSETNWVLRSYQFQLPAIDAAADSGVAVTTSPTTVCFYRAGGQAHLAIDGIWRCSSVLPATWSGVTKLYVYVTGISKQVNLGWVQLVTTE